MKATARWPRVARENAITALRCAVASWFALWWLNAGIGVAAKLVPWPSLAVWKAQDRIEDQNDADAKLARLASDAGARQGRFRRVGRLLRRRRAEEL